MPKGLQLPTIAIIGGGASGTMTAANLLRRAREPLAIVLIERSASVGRGVAYGTTSTRHLLNVPSGKMSAWPDDPDHFLRWLETNGRLPGVTCSTFAPRRLYGGYLEEVLCTAIASVRPGVTLRRVWGEVTDIQVGSDSETAEIVIEDGHLRADRVVLAVGNLPPSNPSIADHSFYQSARYMRSPWAPDALQGLRGDESLLLIGSSLTMLDLVGSLTELGHQGAVHVISRHGLLPQEHRPSKPYAPYLEPDALPTTARSLIRRVRAEVRAAAEQGIDWRPVIDALRPVTVAIWHRMLTVERQRFMRHARCYWEIHRHRAPQEAMGWAKAMLHSGQLTRHVGKIVNYSEDEEGVCVSYLPRHADSGRSLQSLRVERVINCTGPCSRYLKQTHPLFIALRERGLARPDALQLGVEVMPDGAVIAADGRASRTLYTLGTPRKGTDWETTAMPEIRHQAAELAALLLT